MILNTLSGEGEIRMKELKGMKVSFKREHDDCLQYGTIASSPYSSVSSYYGSPERSGLVTSNTCSSSIVLVADIYGVYHEVGVNDFTPLEVYTLQYSPQRFQEFMKWLEEKFKKVEQQAEAYNQYLIERIDFVKSIPPKEDVSPEILMMYIEGCEGVKVFKGMYSNTIGVDVYKQEDHTTTHKYIKMEEWKSSYNNVKFSTRKAHVDYSLLDKIQQLYVRMFEESDTQLVNFLGGNMNLTQKESEWLQPLTDEFERGLNDFKN